MMQNYPIARELVLAGGDEIVGVFDAVADAFLAQQFTDGIVAQELNELVTPDRGEDGHDQAVQALVRVPTT